MAGSFSGNLVNSFESYIAAQRPKGPFGQAAPQIATHGPLAFAPSMHGSFDASGFASGSNVTMDNASMMFDHSSVLSDMSEESSRKIATLQAKLQKYLGPEFVSQRPGPGGGMKLTYAEGWKIINLANEVFGFNGWSSSIVSLTTDFVDYFEETKKYNVGVTAVVRVTLRDGVFHEDVGYGALENSKSKAAALDKVCVFACVAGYMRGVINKNDVL